ncbi:MAG: VOC family protein, partial [Usitatibacteraceae bacterium]
MQARYRDHLGLEVAEWGGVAFGLDEQLKTNPNAVVVWSPFAHDTSYFEPSTASFMINYRVEDLHALLKQLREEGCQVMDKVDESE